MTLHQMSSLTNRIARCIECKHEFEQSKIWEDGCYSRSHWIPSKCLNCKACNKFEVPFMYYPIFMSDFEKPKKTELKKTMGLDKRINKKK